MAVDAGQLVTQRELQVDLRGGRIRVDGFEIGRFSDAGVLKTYGDRMDELVKVNRMMQPGETTFAAHVMVAHRAKVSELMPALCATARRFEVGMVVERKAMTKPSRPKGPSWLEILLAGAKAAGPGDIRADLLSEAFNKTLGRCAALAGEFANLMRGDPEQMRTSLPLAMLRGARRCGCRKVDVEALQAVVLFMVQAEPRHLVKFPLSCDAKNAKPVRLPKDATATDLIRALIPLQSKPGAVKLVFE